MMKYRLFLLMTFTFILTSNAQDKENLYLWPIKDAKVGSSVICAPQGYIDDEFNYANLYIGAQQGALIVSPVDGIITSVGLTYFRSIDETISNSITTSFDKALAQKPNWVSKDKEQYITGHIEIRTHDATIWICGITGDQVFKTGQSIGKGDPIGKVGLSYHKIDRPSICLSISKGNKAADPMSVFGLKSTFIAGKARVALTSLTNEQAKEDFLIYMEALQEVFPGLNNVIDEQEFDKFRTETLAKISSHQGSWTINEFRHLMRQTVAKIHDSHIYMYPPTNTPKQSTSSLNPSMILGWIRDTLICTDATEKHREFIGKQVMSVNGMSADSMKSEYMSLIGGYDQNATAYKDYVLALAGVIPFIENQNLDITFTDGQNVYAQCVENPKFCYGRYKFEQINNHPNSYTLRKINASTAYIGLTNIAFNQTTQDVIAAFIREISDCKNLIIDVRNNGGGQAESLEKIYSYIAQKPVVVSEYYKVKKKNEIKSLGYTNNYGGVTDLFADYEAVSGRDGYYLRSAYNREIVPDSTTNYKGNVYMLVNERSASAATLLPALLIKEGRGVTVGRETRTGYNYMTAEKFAEIRLPNSDIVIKIPMIELGFDTTPNDRIPNGRGVIPDYIIPLTLDELNYVNGDAIMNFTLQLIDSDGKKSGFNYGYIVLIILIAIILITIYYLSTRNRRVRKQSNNNILYSK